MLLDEKEIRQLILNLVRNGLEAMSAGKTITIKTYARENNVFLEVADEGSGIDPDIMDKIDTPFGIQKKNTPNNINHSRQSSKTAMLSGSFLDLSEEKQTREKFALPSEQKPEVVEKTAHERALSLQVSERKATQILDHKGIFQHGDSSK